MRKTYGMYVVCVIEPKNLNKNTVYRPKKMRYCPEGRFTCADFTCISILGRCDRKVDCPNDRADEDGCRMFCLMLLNSLN